MARSFFPVGWRRFRKEFRESLSCVILLDYDGTLTRIVRDPRRAFLSAYMRNLLTRLARQDGVSLGIFSGRKLSKLRQLVGVPGIFYAGNHGLELSIYQQQAVYNQARRAQPLIHRLAMRLSKQLAGIHGVWVEDKGLTCSVHYRRCRTQDISRVLLICDNATQHWRSKGRIRVTEGKKVYEVLPAIEWDKGRAVEWFLRSLPAEARNGCLVYLGDDVTDEDAFQVIRRVGGWGIRVGSSKGRTKASYVVSGSREVGCFLGHLLKELQKSWKVYQQKSRFSSTPAST